MQSREAPESLIGCRLGLAVRGRPNGARVARLAGTVAVIGALLASGGVVTAVHLGIFGGPSTNPGTPHITPTSAPTSVLTPTPTSQGWQAVTLPPGFEGVSRVSCVGSDECWLMGLQQ